MNNAELSTDRRFGLTIGTVCAVIGASLLWFAHSSGLYWVSVGIVLVAAGLTLPRVLRPLNAAWAWLVSPFVMGAIFFIVLTPIAVVLRALKRDPLRLAFEPDKKSYWSDRHPPGPAGDTFPRQF